MSPYRADEELGSSDQQKPAVFLLSIRRTNQRPRKLADVKRIARTRATWLDICKCRGRLALA
jgi:hypothetical protein